MCRQIVIVIKMKHREIFHLHLGCNTQHARKGNARKGNALGFA
jgi:hypothetical protein